MFRAIRVSQALDAPKYTARVDLVTDFDDASLGSDGDIVVDVTHSSINYKDGLALTGRPGVVRSPNLLAGIDLVGTVSSSDSPDWTPGDRVLVNGWGLGEDHHGGLSERARVKSEWLVAVPPSLSNAQAAAIGTAGFTAMLSVLALEKHGVDGEVLVTGASGGVGSLAIAILARLGHSVTASTGKAAEHDYLRSLGATTIIDRATLGESLGKPLQSQRFGAVVDSVGSTTLANALAQVTYGGLATSAGLAQGPELAGTVMPFILRAVTLQGINSVYCPMPLRLEAWNRLGTDLDPDLLDSLTTTVPLDGAIAAAERIMAGSIRGRTVVDVGH
jgi:acrylyl-CoA reductase (NADPH)